MKELTLPQGDSTKSIETNQSVIIIGANGAGKTRLGAWIINNAKNKNLVHRISAQKSLSFPDTTNIKAIENAENALLNGHETHSSFHRRADPISASENFDKLLVYLFSEETEENAKFKQACRDNVDRIEPPKTKIDLVKELWEKILPHRELIIGGLRIQTRIKGQEGKVYKSSEMSDGERVIFYLIGNCLAAPKNGIIVIDEPELHLHKSVQTPLWDAIEKLRQDCLFVYLTHDVDFAAAKNASQNIWLKSFDGEKWDWSIIHEDESLPNELIIEVLGSRKPVVFVEGESCSFDSSLYRELLSNFLVIPRGSCSQVIESVKALKSNSQFHHLNVYGVIDRDRRLQAEIMKLEQDSIYVLEVAEVENLFCTEEVLKIVSERLARDPLSDFLKVSTTIFGRLQSELDIQVSLHVSNEVKFRLNVFDVNKRGVSNINAALHDLVTSIDVNKIYSDTSKRFTDVLESKDYRQLLAIYNRKSLCSQISTQLGLSNGSLPETIVRLLKGECKDSIKSALKPYFGKFQQHMT
ncbi:hypothetical protein VI35_09795 [Aeromonas caviae]|uniref:DUF4435 domain-containing protein n=1 Tax=Aeromonas caviae TaxID=648 RepID=UPI0009BB9BF2|nr:DUF4435 domain-containing protein [Aeromonas caviae]ATP90523.1 hypothetical protein VI35_09795 [Aeromonas caviae]